MSTQARRSRVRRGWHKDFGDRFAVDVRKVDVEQPGKRRRKIHDRHGALERSRRDAGPDRDEHASGEMVTGAAEAILALELTDLPGTEPYLRDGAVARPLDQKIREMVPVIAVIEVVGSEDAVHDALAGVEIHDVHEVPGELGAQSVELRARPDLSLQLAPDEVHADATVGVIILDDKAPASRRIDKARAWLSLRNHPRAKRLPDRLQQRAQRRRRVVPAPRQERVEAVAQPWCPLGFGRVVDRGRRNVETQQNPVQENLGAVLVAHAVAGEHDDRGAVVNPFQHFADGRVDRDVDVPERIADDARLFRVVPWMARIVDMPALVPDAVTLAEDLAEEIPFGALQEVLRDLRLDADPPQQLFPEFDEVLCVAVGVADDAQRVSAEACLDLVGERRRPRDETILRIVRAPLDQLHAVQILRQARKGNIEHRHVAPGATQVIPEGLALQLIADQAAIGLVRAGFDLHPRIDAASGRVASGLEGGPRRARVDPRQAHRVAPESPLEERLERRQDSFVRPVLDEVSVTRIETEEDDFALHADPYSVKRCIARAAPPSVPSMHLWIAPAARPRNTLGDPDPTGRRSHSVSRWRTSQYAILATCRSPMNLQ